MPMHPLSAVVLAAGEGTRMRSVRPKPLHRLCGRAMVLHVLDAVAELEVDRAVVVVGHAADRVSKALAEQAPPGLMLEFVEQQVPAGTGDALSVAMTAFAGADDDLDPEHEADLIVLAGDTPLLRPPTLAALVRRHRGDGNSATVLTARLPDPTGYGRVLRGRDGGVARIVEQRDTNEEEAAVDEVNVGIYVFRRGLVAPTLRRLTPANAQGEYYLTDTVQVLARAGYKVGSMVMDDPTEAAGVNDRAQLAAAEAELRDRINERWMRRGVTMIDPERTYLDTSVELASDVCLYPGTILQGRTKVQAGAEIGPDTRLVDCQVGPGAVVEGVVGRQASIGAGARVGPFVVLHPGSSVAADAITGSHLVVTPDT